MKYAKEVIELMGAYPGRKFRMMEIVKYIKPSPSKTERQAIRVSISRVLFELVDSGHILMYPPLKQGGFAVYEWRAK